jgi:SAM-dependent methyltransferase/uncharacterized protein YbaR (Trm112 family)
VNSPSEQLAAARQDRLLTTLVCPECHAKLRVRGGQMVNGCVATADLTCATCGDVGVISSFRPSFLERDRGNAERASGAVVEPLILDLDRFVRTGRWQMAGPRIHGEGAGARLSGFATGRGIRLEFLTHAWSGSVLVSFGETEEIIDLYSAEPGSRFVDLVSEFEGEHVWTVTILEATSNGFTQAYVSDIAHLVPTSAARPLDFVPLNLGNPYPARFEEILSELPDGAAVLDLGGGDRRHVDPRVFNLEYLPYYRVDLYADGLKLPFADKSFDFILSQAVLEHVPDPAHAVSEILRVLRPGGKIYAEFAFMQPLHAVPFHFFNITPHGATLLFERFDSVKIGSFGGLGDTMRWFFRLLDAQQKVGPDVVGSVLAGLDKLDPLLSPDELAMLSSAVWVEALRPVDQ